MIKAKKSLGQNFLTDRVILDKIVNTAPIENKTILEVGPGTGNLTSFILKKETTRHVIMTNLIFQLEQIRLKLFLERKLLQDQLI